MNKAQHLNRYALLGLRQNPFGHDPEDVLPSELWITRPDQPNAPAANQGLLYQLVGVCGAGKSSLMRQWCSQAPGPFHYVEFGSRAWALPPLADLCYWDELDRLPLPLQLLQLSRARLRKCTIVAGTHRDLSRLARSCGLRVESYHFSPINQQILYTWAMQRITKARLSGHKLRIDLTQAPLAQIAKQAQGSWRNAASLLHIWVAQQAQNNFNSQNPQNY